MCEGEGGSVGEGVGEGEGEGGEGVGEGGEGGGEGVGGGGGRGGGGEGVGGGAGFLIITPRLFCGVIIARRRRFTLFMARRAQRRRYNVRHSK